MKYNEKVKPNLSKVKTEKKKKKKEKNLTEFSKIQLRKI